MKLYALDPLLHPIDEDMLHKKTLFVEHCYQMITQDIEPPFAISIDGLWGTGKTTVMRMLRNKLIERDEGYPVIWFNPWEYQEAESIVLAFLQRFADEMMGTIDKAIRKSLKILGTVGLLSLDIALTALPSKILSFNLEKIKKTGEEIEEGYLKEYEKYKDVIKCIRDDFKYLINGVSKQHYGKPVIIFFDDLDRCLPDKTIQLLEAIKNLFVVPDSKVIFVCGIDTHIAKQFIKSHYKDIEETFAINYFRKIFNLTISVPCSSEIYQLLLKYIKNLYDWDDSYRQEAEALANMVYIQGLEVEITSVRHYLNIINNFYMFQKFNPKYTFTPENDFIVYLLLVKEAWQPLYENLIREALRERSNMETLIQGFIHKYTKDKSLLPKQEKFLSDYLGRIFAREQLSIWLEQYPTLA